MINLSLITLAIDKVIDNNLLEIIKNFCPNIQNLSLGLFNTSFPEILPSLIYNLPLNHLYLDIFGYNFSDVLIDLTNSIPSTVISLYINFTLLPNQLDYFLNEMKAKPKILGIIDKYMIKNDHLEIIIKYAKIHNNNLKELHWFGNLDDEIIKDNMNEAKSIIPLICYPIYNFLVNKTWWSQTIDILWSQPFRLLYSCISKLEDSPTCNYQSTSTEIIEKLDYSEIIKYLADPKVLMELRNTISQYQIISEIILNFFMRKCKNNLRRLSFDVNQIYHKSIFNPCKDYQRYSTALSLYKRGVRDNPEYKVAEIYLSLPKYFNAINCLSNIRELICTTKRNMSNFFLSLSKYVHNLDKLEINIDHSVEANYLNWLLSRESSFLREEVANLIKLIHKQKNLSHFILHNCPVDFSLVMEELKESHAKNLKSLKKIYLPNLKKIDLNNSFIPHQFLQYLLQICSSNLKYLDIGKRYSKYSLIGSNFNPIQFISTNFSNIKFLKCDLLPFENNHFISLLSYNSYYIQSIILDNYEENNNFAKCLSILSEINFDNLKYFGIRGNFIFSEFTLSKFLVNNIRKNRGLNLHVLEFTKNIWFDNDYLKEILKCLDNGFTCNKLIITTIGEIKPELLAKAREKIKVVQCVEMRG
ncbi:9203_t:CDS:2 [Rhizophagus irregularis]|nr:9203_t:CDS:2 [Rhizophagus irregularis]